MTTGEEAPRGAKAALLTAAREELSEHGDAAISLRAVARRAGVSHAAPKYFFADRAGLLTSVATSGFRELTERLRVARAGDGTVTGAGRVYVDFGVDEPALFDLMFRSADLHTDDADLMQAKADALGELTAVVGGSDAAESAELTLGNWAFAHGLVVLAREQALGSQTASSANPREMAYRLLDVFTAG